MMEGNHALSHMAFLSRGHVTNRRSNFSSFARHMTSKLGRVVTYVEDNLPMKLHDPLIG